MIKLPEGWRAHVQSREGIAPVDELALNSFLVIALWNDHKQTWIYAKAYKVLLLDVAIEGFDAKKRLSELMKADFDNFCGQAETCAHGTTEVEDRSKPLKPTPATGKNFTSLAAFELGETSWPSTSPIEDDNWKILPLTGLSSFSGVDVL
jgi:hypothetical protein